MTLNYPGPYELRYTYSVNGREHVFQQNLFCQEPITPGTTFDLINGLDRNGGSITLDVWVDSVWSTVEWMYNAADIQVGICELWAYSPNSFQASFVSAYTPVFVSNGQTGTTKPASQSTFTMRTTEGGIVKLVLLDTRFDDNAVYNYPTGITEIDAIFWLYLNPAFSLPIGRDTSFPFAGLRYLNGQNERLFRAIYR